MDYIKTFKECKIPEGKLEKILYSAKISYEFFEQFIKEYTGTIKRRIEEPYLKEEDITNWLGCFSLSIQSILFNAYFRPELHNQQNIPINDGALIVANHSGMWGWDGLAVLQAVYKAKGRAVSMITHNIFENSDILKTFGAIIGNRQEAKALLKEGRLALVCPGGAREVAKPIWKRYKMQKLGGFAEGKHGYLRVAITAKKPIIPAGIVGAEETHINLGDIKPYLESPIENLYNLLKGQPKTMFRPLHNALKNSQACPLTVNLIPFPSKIGIYTGKPIPFHEDLSKDELKTLQNNRTDKTIEAKLSKMNETTMERIQLLIKHGRSQPK